MKTRIMLGALIMAAVIGSSVGVGYAGSDGGGGPGGISLFQCYAVGGDTVSNPPHVLDINDQFTNATAARVGKLKLLCAPTTFDLINDEDATLHPEVEESGGADHITCYESGPVQATQSVVFLNDAFGEQTVTVQGVSRFVCVKATKDCLSGCPVQ